MSEKVYERTHMCGQITRDCAGLTVKIAGWVNRKRELGEIVFITLRDQTGLVQVVVGEAAFGERLKSIKSEYVLYITGTAQERAAENKNEQMKTGDMEIAAASIEIISEAQTPPFHVFDPDVSEDLRLKYRYIDLRRPQMQEIILLRHSIKKAARDFLDAEGFIDIETPFLTKTTPEGARDYLVPSRVNRGAFYALPQSPQLLKQILMISGFDRYYQITKCFRDEDLRADRQPEFTQIDLEMSFADTRSVMSVNERLVKHILKTVSGREIEGDFPKMTYAEAMRRFGTDKPDTRFAMEITDLTQIGCVKNSAFPLFANAISQNGAVCAITAKNCAGYSRRQQDALADIAKTYKAGGLCFICAAPDGALKASFSKFMGEAGLREIADAANASAGDLIIICAGGREAALNALGYVRLRVGEQENLIDKNAFAFLWVTDFPLFEWSKEDNRFYSKHHPFTAPDDDDLPLLDTAPENARSKAYDLVLNGAELGGGSIRIHNPHLQRKIFSILGISDEDAEKRFGFFLEAFKYAAPPHGGLAFGLDRMCMLFGGRDNIRDVIAFPKTQNAACPLTGAPDSAETGQLAELGLSYGVS